MEQGQGRICKMEFNEETLDFNSQDLLLVSIYVLFNSIITYIRKKINTSLDYEELMVTKESLPFLRYNAPCYSKLTRWSPITRFHFLDLYPLGPSFFEP